MYELILLRNHSDATAVMRSFQTNRSLIVTWKRTTSELQNVRLLVIRVEKPFTTAPLSTLMSAHQQQQTTVNAALRLQMTHQLRKNLRGRPKQVWVQRQNHQHLSSVGYCYWFQLASRSRSYSFKPHSCRGGKYHRHVPSTLAPDPYPIQPP